MLGNYSKHFLQAYSLAADFERGCIELATLLPYSVEQIKEAARQVGCESTHPSHWIPEHLHRLIMNKWIVEQTPEDFQIQAIVEFPFECDQGCLGKFYALLKVSR